MVHGMTHVVPTMYPALRSCKSQYSALQPSVSEVESDRRLKNKIPDMEAASTVRRLSRQTRESRDAEKGLERD